MQTESHRCHKQIPDGLIPVPVLNPLSQRHAENAMALQNLAQTKKDGTNLPLTQHPLLSLQHWSFVELHVENGNVRILVVGRTLNI